MGISPCGRDWLIAALDPFHDNRLEHLTGWPDAVANPSIIRSVKQSLDISTNSSEDFHVVAWPWLGSLDAGVYVQTGSTVALPGASTLRIPSVAVYKATAGLDFSYSAAPADGLLYPDNMQEGLGRLVGMGIELVNTTAPINRSGSLYSWRLPGYAQDEPIQYLTGATLTRSNIMRNCSTPPFNTSQATLISGTRVWASEEGAYLVVPFEGDNEPTYPTQSGPIVSVNDANGPIKVGSNNVRNVFTVNSVTTSQAIRLIPTALTGIISAGNNPNSKFTLHVVWYFEEFPDTESSVLTLATPSCEYDPAALEVYTSVINSLPICVPSDWNESGDWWNDVVSAIRNHATTIGTMLGGPAGAAIGTAAGTLAGWVQDRYMTSPGTGNSGVPPKQKQRKKKKNRAGQNQVPNVARAEMSSPPSPRRQPNKQPGSKPKAKR